MNHTLIALLFSLSMLMDHFANADELTATVRAGILSAPHIEVLDSSPNFAIYVEFDFSNGAETQKPINIHIWSTPAWVYEPFLNQKKLKLLPGKLNEFTRCAHSQELFEQFSGSQNSGNIKNTGTLPIAIRCDQGQFLFMYYKHAGTPIANELPVQMAGSYEWFTKNISLMWWASREELVPLEDLSKIPQPRKIIEEKLTLRSSGTPQKRGAP